MANLNLKEALRVALEATKTYIDDNHYNQTEIDSLLDLKSDEGHTHKYAGSSSAGGAATSANKVNTNLVVKLNGGTTEGTNLFTFNGSAAKTIDITPSAIGAAPTSHASTATTYGVSSASNYGHAMASSTTPKANGTAAVGSETAKFARGDHVHPAQTSVSGNAGTATKFASAQSVALTGDVTGSASSQAGWSVATTLSNSGVTAGSYGPSADASPAHKGTFTVPYITVDAKGRVTAASTKTITLPADNNSTYTNMSLGNGYGTCATEEATTAKVVTLSNYALQTGGQVSVKFTYAVPASATMNINSKGAKNIFYKGAAIVAGVIKAGDIATFIYDGTQYQLIAIDRWQADTAGSIKALSVSGKVITYTKNDGTTGTITTQDNNTTYTANTGIKLNGTTFQHTNAVTAGTAQGDANKTLSWGGTFTIPTVTYDAQGHITAKGTTTMTMPSNPNSDTKVKNTLGTTTKFYVTGTTSSTTATGEQYFDTGVYVSTTAGELVATKFTGALNGNANTATKATQDSAGQQINTTYIKGLSVSGKTITYTKGDGTTGTITTQDTNTTYSAATQSAAGLMSAADKTKLDGIATGANNYTHPNSGATAGSYGNSSNQTPAYGATFNVPYLTVNATGHVTAISNKTVKIPASDNTWRGVQNNLTSTATDQSLSAAQGKILNDTKADKTLLGEDLSSKTISLNDLNLSSGSPKFKVYYCPTDGGGSNITGRPNDSSKQAFNLIVESLRWASTTDYITKQTYTQGSQKIIYVRYCTNGTWTAWEKVYTSGQKPTAADIGAAPTSHASTATTYGVSSASNYGHAMASSTTPKANGTAAVGSETAKFARGDHVHPLQTTVSGNAGTATKLATARTINGTSFDGTANITTANWGTARNIYIADNSATNTGPAVSVNGSANATLKLPATIKAALTGNATTATTLATARTINGTSFNGSANITTANWGTARTVTIGNTGKSVNGSANVTWTHAEMGVARGNTVSATTAATAQWYRIAETASDIANNMATFNIQGAVASYHTSTLLAAGISYGKNPTLIQLAHTNYGAGITKARIVYHTTYSGNKAYLEVYLSQAKATAITVDMQGKHGWTLVAPSTVGSIPSGYTSKEITLTVDKIVANIQGNVSGSSGSCTGNAATATTLKTARTINGTSFNGSANITTANWGTARTLTIGSTGKSVNGSGNVSWSLSEIGAAASSHTHSYAGSSSAGGAANSVKTNLIIKLNGGSTEGTDLFTFNGSTAKTVNITPSGIGAAASSHTHSYAGSSSAGGAANSVKTNLIIKLNGGSTEGTNLFTFNGSTAKTINITPSAIGAAPTSHASTATTYGVSSASNYGHAMASSTTPKANGTAAVGSETAKFARGDHVHPLQTTVSGNAGTATKLATARTINGTSFNGSANITTANWGTARNIYIADSSATNTGSAVSVNGSANATLKLPATIKATLTGNATTATTLATARTLTLGATGKTFNGSADVSWSLQEIMKGQGLNASTAMNTLYFNNAGVDHVGRVSTYRNSNSALDYVQLGLYNVADSGTVCTLNLYPTHTYTANEFWCASNIRVNGKKLHITASAPSSPSTGDIWIDI